MKCEKCAIVLIELVLAPLSLLACDISISFTGPATPAALVVPASPVLASPTLRVLVVTATPPPTSLPTQTPIPSRTKTATSTFAPTPTASAVPPSSTPRVVLASFGCPGAGGTRYWYDDFSNPQSGWVTYRGADYEHFYKDDEWHFEVFKTNTMGNVWMLLKDLGTRYRVEVDAHKLAGPNMNDYGLLFGGQNDTTYDAFLITDTGSYEVFKKVDGRRYDIAAWTKTLFVNQGGLNFLGLSVEGTQFTVCLNGQVLTTMNDPTLKSGRVGMVAGAFDEPVHIHFDNFGVWKPQ